MYLDLLAYWNLATYFLVLTGDSEVSKRSPMLKDACVRTADAKHFYLFHSTCSSKKIYFLFVICYMCLLCHRPLKSRLLQLADPDW
jgi:hypothetical protein